MKSTDDLSDLEIDDIIRLDDRVDIFHHLTVDKATDEVNAAIFEGLLDKYYNDFVDFCQKVEGDDKVKDVSCHIADGKIYFHIFRYGDSTTTD